MGVVSGAMCRLPSPRRSRLTRAGLAAAGVSAIIGVIAAIGLGPSARSTATQLDAFQRSPPTRPSPATPGVPKLTVRQRTLINEAQDAVSAVRASCSPVARNVPVTSDGAPDVALTSALGVLRRPATPVDAAIKSRLPYPPGIGGARPAPGTNPPPLPGADVFVNAIREARTAFGTTYYIVPAGRETGLRLVPAACDALERAALKRELAAANLPRANRVLQLQRKYLSWQRNAAEYPEGILLGTVNHASIGIDGGVSLTELEQRGALDFNSGYPGRSLLDGVVPDGVASVIVRYTNRTAILLPVIDNMFVTTKVRAGAGEPKAIVWRSHSRHIIKTIPIAAFQD